MDLLDQHGNHQSLDIKQLSLGDDGEFKDTSQPYTIELDSDGEPVEQKQPKKRGRKPAAKPKAKRAPAKKQPPKKKSMAAARSRQPKPKPASLQDIEAAIDKRFEKLHQQAKPPAQAQPVYQSSYEQMFMPMVQQEPVYDPYEMYRCLPTN